jgi:glycosyltransferase involved in cell wall biosynthesis
VAGCGFWVPQDPRAIGAALARLLDDPARARAMGDRGRALARGRYAWDAIGRGMAAEYREIAARAGGLAPVA